MVPTGKGGPKVKHLRAVGGVLVGMGAALAGVTILGMLGWIPLTIDFFGIDLDTVREQATFAAACGLALALGLALLRLGRRVHPAAGAN